MDIGCGQGTIMEMASDYFSSVKGVEPSRVEVEIAREKGLEVAQTYFDRTWKEENYSAFITTQVLEHLPDPRETIETAYRILIPGGAGYIDVPNGYRIYQEGRYFDVFAEHINYWSVNSLTKLLSECGFCIVEAGEILNGDHIGVYVKKPRNHTTFEGRKRRDFEKAGDIFQRYRSVSVWGAGVKGREFIRTSLSDKPVAHLFDSNPTLNGRYVAGCAAPVETPSESGIRGSDAIILTAVEYKNEIISTLREKYGFKGVLIGIDEI